MLQTGISSGLMGHLARMQTLPFYTTTKPHRNFKCLKQGIKNRNCLKQGRKISDICLKQGQGMRGRAAPPHPRIYRVPPPGTVQEKVFSRRSAMLKIVEEKTLETRLAIDLIMNAIDQRFDQPSFDTYATACKDGVSLKDVRAQKLPTHRFF